MLWCQLTKRPRACDRGFHGCRGYQTKATDECANLDPAVAGPSLAHSGPGGSNPFDPSSVPDHQFQISDFQFSIFNLQSADAPRRNRAGRARGQSLKNEN
jgi:hypothetical protein